MHEKVAFSELHTWPDACHQSLSPILIIHKLPPPKILSLILPASPQIAPLQLLPTVPDGRLTEGPTLP